jgi:hypothetical protein
MTNQVDLFEHGTDVSKNSQCGQILEHLQSGKTITPLEALNMFGCFRLGARCWDLKKTGYDIKTRMAEKNGKRFAEYYL